MSWKKEGSQPRWMTWVLKDTAGLANVCSGKTCLPFIVDVRVTGCYYVKVLRRLRVMST